MFTPSKKHLLKPYGQKISTGSNAEKYFYYHTFFLCYKCIYFTSDYTEENSCRLGTDRAVGLAVRTHSLRVAAAVVVVVVVEVGIDTVVAAAVAGLALGEVVAAVNCNTRPIWVVVAVVVRKQGIGNCTPVVGVAEVAVVVAAVVVGDSCIEQALGWAVEAGEVVEQRG